MSHQKISFLNSQQQTLAGLKTLPANFELNQKYPALICAHGFALDKSCAGLFDQIADQASKQNWLTYRFDFAGSGESTGDYADTTLTQQKNDVQQIVNFVQQDNLVIPEKTVILGHSLGGAVVAAAQIPAAGTILLAPITNPHFSVSNLFGPNFNPQGLSTKQWTETWQTTVKPSLWQDLSQYPDLSTIIPDLDGHKLFIHGTADNKALPIESEKYFHAAQDPKKLELIDGADHLFNQHRPELLTIISNWLDLVSHA